MEEPFRHGHERRGGDLDGGQRPAARLLGPPRMGAFPVLPRLVVRKRHEVRRPALVGVRRGRARIRLLPVLPRRAQPGRGEQELPLPRLQLGEGPLRLRIHVHPVLPRGLRLPRIPRDHVRPRPPLPHLRRPREEGQPLQGGARARRLHPALGVFALLPGRREGAHEGGRPHERGSADQSQRRHRLEMGSPHDRPASVLRMDPLERGRTRPAASLLPLRIRPRQGLQLQLAALAYPVHIRLRPEPRQLRIRPDVQLHQHPRRLPLLVPRHRGPGFLRDRLHAAGLPGGYHRTAPEARPHGGRLRGERTVEQGRLYGLRREEVHREPDRGPAAGRRRAVLARAGQGAETRDAHQDGRAQADHFRSPE